MAGEKKGNSNSSKTSDDKSDDKSTKSSGKSSQTLYAGIDVSGVQSDNSFEDESIDAQEQTRQLDRKIQGINQQAMALVRNLDSLKPRWVQEINQIKQASQNILNSPRALHNMAPKLRRSIGVKKVLLSEYQNELKNLLSKINTVQMELSKLRVTLRKLEDKAGLDKVKDLQVMISGSPVPGVMGWRHIILRAISSTHKLLDNLEHAEFPLNIVDPGGKIHEIDEIFTENVQTKLDDIDKEIETQELQELEVCKNNFNEIIVQVENLSNNIPDVDQDKLEQLKKQLEDIVRDIESFKDSDRPQVKLAANFFLQQHKEDKSLALQKLSDMLDGSSTMDKKL